MIGLAFVLSGSRIAAEDLAQEGLLSAYRTWNKVGLLDQRAAWVRNVVANNSWSLLGRKKAESRALARSLLGTGWAPMPELPLVSEELWTEVRPLPRRQAQAVALYYVAGLTMAEIADTLGCTKDTFNTHLRRTRSTLAHRLVSRSGEFQRAWSRLRYDSNSLKRNDDPPRSQVAGIAKRIPARHSECPNLAQWRPKRM